MIEIAEMTGTAHSRYLRVTSRIVMGSLVIAGGLVPARFTAVMRKCSLSPVTKPLSKTDVRSVRS